MTNTVKNICVQILALGKIGWKASDVGIGMKGISPTHSHRIAIRFNRNWKAARRFGLAQIRTEQIIDQSRRISTVAGDVIERRLLDEGDDLPIKDVGIIRGIENDKLARYEGWGTDVRAGGSFTDTFDSALAKLVEGGGGSVSVRVEVDPAASDPLGEAIDVTPERGK